MKKLRFVWVLFSLLVFLTSLAAAPLAGSAISLVEVRNDAGGGVIFIFNVSGEFSRSELKGFVEVQGADANYDLHCTQKDATTVHCTTSRKTGGQNVVVTFGGATFWTYVPDSRPLPSSCQFEYFVYDWNEFELSTSTAWESFHTFCTDTPAQDGDVISSNLWDGIFAYDYEYFSTGVDNAYCGWANPGAGYYYMDDYACFD